MGVVKDLKRILGWTYVCFAQLSKGHIGPFVDTSTVEANQMEPRDFIVL